MGLKPSDVPLVLSPLPAHQRETLNSARRVPAPFPLHGEEMNKGKGIQLQIITNSSSWICRRAGSCLLCNKL